MNENKEYISWERYNQDIHNLAINVEKLTPKFLYGIPRGGLVVAVHLSHLISIPLIVHPTELPIGTVIIDDVSDTGKTLLPFKKKHYKIVTLYRKDGTKVEPDYCCDTINTWIVFPWEE